jgi:integrase
MNGFSHTVEEYLRLRRSFGHDLVHAARLLPRFAEHLDAAGAEFVTIDAALSWALEPEAMPGSDVRATRMSVVRGFARYLAGIDPRTEIPPAGLIPFRKRWRTPFIYSETDVVALMAEARRSIPQPLRAATLETLIGLLAATGVRIGEAIRLGRGDIDWSEGVLFVECSKFKKSRQVPLQASTLEALTRYARAREKLCPEPRDESFFVSPRGTRLSYTSVRRAFRLLCEAAGVGAESTLRPRIHGLRHLVDGGVMRPV